MPGTRTRSFPVVELMSGYSSAATTAGQHLLEVIVPFHARIGAVAAHAGTAGVGAGNEVLDVQVDGVSIWANTADRPTLLGTSTGEFANTVPTTRSVRSGAVMRLAVITIPATTGQARVKLNVTLEVQ